MNIIIEPYGRQRYTELSVNAIILAQPQRRRLASCSQTGPEPRPKLEQGKWKGVIQWETKAGKRTRIRVKNRKRTSNSRSRLKDRISNAGIFRFLVAANPSDS